MGVVHARDDGRWANSPYKDWYGQQHDANGKWCCDNSDAHPYEGDYQLNDDGSVTLENGIKIEAYKVIKKPNPTGSAVWWYVQPTSDSTFCFALGSLT